MFSSVPTISRIFYPAFFLIFIGTFAFVSAQIRVEPVGSEVRPGLPEVFGGKGAGGCCDGSHKPGEAGPVSFGAMQYETYRVSATYYSLNDGLTTTLMLNNKGPQPIQATPTFYSLAGTRLTLAPITVPATSYIDVDMHELLSGAGAEFWEGSLKISYSGISLQLGAQVKMVDEQNGLIWAEQLVYGSKFVSSRLEALWWLPFQNTETKVVVSNTSSDTITATLNVDGTSPHQSAPLQISLAPWETRVLDILRDIAGHQNGHIHSEGGISITHTGAPGAVLARMFIAKRNKGYSAAVNFVDPEATASQRWHGSGLRFRNLNGAQLTPVIAVRNTGGQASRVNGKIIYTQPNGDAATINLPQRTIDPGTTRVFNLQSFINGLPASVTYGGIEIEYDTPKGSIITSVQSGSPNGEHVFEVPMMDPEKMPSSAGGFPWKADGDFRTVVYIKNETDVVRKITAFLTWPGGVYATGTKDVKARQTVAIDFRELRDNQTPDGMGNLIPLDLEAGQIAWSVKGSKNKVLSARSEQISVAEGMASTYSCANCCPNVITDLFVNPDEAEVEFGDITPFNGTQYESNCYNQSFGPYAADTIEWDSYDTNIATIDSSGDSEAVGVGSTTIEGCVERTIWYNWGGGYCEPSTAVLCNNAPVESRPHVSIDEFKAVGKNQTAIIKVTVSGNSNNEDISLTLSPNSGTGTAHFTDTNSTTSTIKSTTNVEIKGITESSTKDNMRLTASYNGRPYGSGRSFTVISISISFRLTSADSVSSDNSARPAYYELIGTYQLGGPFLSSGPNVKWRHAIEIVGTVSPSNFSDSIILQREVVSHREYDGANNLTDSRGPFADTSDAPLRDDNPQSGNSQGKVYDLDAPGAILPAPPFTVNDIRRRRTNFRQWATISQKQAGVTTNVRVSDFVNWYQRLSLVVNSTNSTVINNDVANDNLIGAGSTSITWNLQ